MHEPTSTDEPVHGLVIWTPAGEADALVNAGVFKPRPLDDKKQ